MKVYYFSEQAYPDAWLLPDHSMRITLANRHCDPQVLTDLYKRYHDEWVLADETGFDGIMVNEHHSTSTCLSPNAVVGLSILARITKKARILALGMPIANRPDPVRVAEEAAAIDVISGGRLELGLVRGVPYESVLAPSTPATMTERFWEAHDIIVRALSERNGPFSFEGKHFQYRAVNVWPRPYQDPHPPIWITSSGSHSIRKVAEKGYVAAMFLGGYKVGEYFQSYRDAWRETWGTEAPMDRFAYSGLCAIGSTDAEVRERAEKIVGVIKINERIADAFRNPHGYMSVDDNVRIMRMGGRFGQRPVSTRTGRPVTLATCSIEDLIEAGILFAGKPDQVYDQIVRFSDGIGGIGTLLMMMQGGFMNAAETADSIRLFTSEVMPRLRDYTVTPQERAA